MRKAELAASVMVPSLSIAQASLSLSMMQTGGSFLDFLRPAMPFFSEILGFFGNLLIPIGEYFGTLLQGPLTTLSEAIPARSVTGYALYFIVFAGIFVLALMLNVVWRPLGYATADSRAKREAKEARMAEKEELREAAKAETKAKAKGGRNRSKAESIEKDKEGKPKEDISGEPRVGTDKDGDKRATDSNPLPEIVEEKDEDDGGQVEEEDADDDDGAGEKADEDREPDG